MLKCRKCDEPIPPASDRDDIKSGHKEYDCSCGQLLQWDVPVGRPRREVFSFGERPMECQCGKKKPDSLMPC